ncbi:hypothetical protein [Legionella qingyii]|uniref:hypothetical protein n=1 Tax=Legionella qingyii TaxID=2184757 RepID=UPI0010578B51|nr:hypothetical protein [Legionella qingyii]
MRNKHTGTGHRVEITVLSVRRPVVINAVEHVIQDISGVRKVRDVTGYNGQNNGVITTIGVSCVFSAKPVCPNDIVRVN